MNPFDTPISLAIIAITTIVSMQGFYNPMVKEQLLFRPYTIQNRGDWFRFISSGMIHADWLHLIFNMYTFYSFGPFVELYFGDIFDEWGRLVFVFYYVSAIAAAQLPVYFKQKDNPLYGALGASGAVSAVILTTIFLVPTVPISLFFLPTIPGFLFAIIYMAVSSYLGRRSDDNIAHDVHFYGAVYGFVFLIPFRPDLAKSFAMQVVDYMSSF